MLSLEPEICSLEQQKLIENILIFNVYILKRLFSFIFMLLCIGLTQQLIYCLYNALTVDHFTLVSMHAIY